MSDNQLVSLAEDFFQNSLDSSPTSAIMRGHKKYFDQIEELTEEQFQKEKDIVDTFIQRLNAIEKDNLTSYFDDVGVTMSLILLVVFISSFIITQIFVDDISSKRAIRMIFDSWRPMLKNYNIKTICICPGFIDTAMVSRKTGILPLRSPIDAAEKFLVSIKKGKINYVYPWQYYILILIDILN